MPWVCEHSTSVPLVRLPRFYPRLPASPPFSRKKSTFSSVIFHSLSTNSHHPPWPPKLSSLPGSRLRKRTILGCLPSFAPVSERRCHYHWTGLRQQLPRFCLRCNGHWAHGLIAVSRRIPARCSTRAVRISSSHLASQSSPN